MVSGVSEAGLSTTGAAGRQRRADLARRHRGREIPRRHQHGDARRLVVHDDARARGRRARKPADVAHRLLGVPAEELGGVGNLTARVRKRLAVLDGDQLGEPLGVAHDQLEGLAQDFGALARLPARPSPGRRRLRRRPRPWRPRPSRSRPTRPCSRSPDRSRRSGRRRRICATCRRSRDRSGHWREDCRIIELMVTSIVTRVRRSSSGARDRRCARPSAARCLPECRRPAAECAGW